MFDLVIRRGTVIDGSGAPRRRADVAIDAGRIVGVGGDIGRGRDELDASGRIVAPGFIDSHAHDDLALLVEPALTAKISQGVTTCVCGNCGISLAPLPDGELPEPLDEIVGAAGLRFADAAQFLEALRATPAALNSVPLLGHSALRAAVMDRTDRPATRTEIAAMRERAHAALLAGYHGISTGTFYASAAHASTAEIVAVCEPLSRVGGVYTTHLRDEADHVVSAIDEAAAIGRSLGVRVIVSHHKVAGVRNHGRSVETLARIASLQATQAMALDCYPYVASSTVLSAGRVAMAERVLITSSRPFPHYAGREARELAAELGIGIAELCERLHPAGATYFTMSEADVERILAFPSTMIGSDGLPLQDRPHPRLWGTFSRVLGRYCRDRGLFSLETAVHKMTGLPAACFGLVDRGRIAPGMAADITVFDADTIADTATFDDPERPAAGIDCVIVNGAIAWRAGRAGALAGKLLAPARASR